ncbi:MAG: 6-phosphogluconate dehydrogenase, partial [Polaromonas sp.]
SANVIEAAVGARAWSADRDVRGLGAALLGDRIEAQPIKVNDLAEALLSARILAYAQGFALIGAASEEFVWDVDRAEVAEIWRAGCIIRSALLDEIATSTRAGLPGDALYLADGLRMPLMAGVPALRRVVASAVTAGVPVPALSGALAYLDTMRQPRGFADLIQAQRDFFGAHGFGRVDAKGQHHGPWGGLTSSSR